MSEAVWLNPAEIEFKLSPTEGLVGRRGGDWDIERRHPLAETKKHVAVRRHFVDGVPWEETTLFTEIYRTRLALGPVRGCQTVDELAAYYRDRVDPIFASLQRDGFREIVEGRRVPLPSVSVGRNGERFIGDQGNHRVAMAQIIGLARIAVEIVCIHAECPC